MTQIHHAALQNPGASPANSVLVRPAAPQVQGDFREQLRSVIRRLPNEEGRAGDPGGVLSSGLPGWHLAGRPDDCVTPRKPVPETDSQSLGGLSTPERETSSHGQAGLATTENNEYDVALGVERWTDPLVRVLSTVTSNPMGQAQPAPAGVVDRIAQQLIRKVGLGASSVHLEFGAGLLAEGKLLVQSTNEGLEITLDAPPGVDASNLSAALALRLERKGLKVSRLEVT